MVKSDADRLIAVLDGAKFVEIDNGLNCRITLAHLSGEVSFCDGVMYWSRGDAGGEKVVDQHDIDNSARALRNYGRTAVRNNLERTAKRLLAEARKSA